MFQFQMHTGFIDPNTTSIELERFVMIILHVCTCMHQYILVLVFHTECVMN